MAEDVNQQAESAISRALASAKGMLGKNEVPDRSEIIQYLHDGGQDLDPHKVAWCAAFVSASLQKAGIPVPTQVVKDSAFGPGAYAPNYLSYGTAVNPKDIQAGDILVNNNGSHVGFAEGPIRQGPNGPEVQLLAGNERDLSGQYAPGSYTSPKGTTAQRSQVGMVGERWVPLSQYSARRYVPSDTANAAPATPSTPSAQGTTINSTNQDAIIDQLSKNIAGIESGGFKNPYQALGSDVGGGRGQAIGKYQVMPENVPGWTLMATGKSMTPEEFRASPEAQEAVFRDQMKRNLQLYGPKDAASIWFTGKPFNVAGAGASDKNKTTNLSYVTRATQGINNDGTFTPGPAVASSGTPSPPGPLAAAPDDRPWWAKWATDPPTDREGKPIAGAQSPLQQVSQAIQGRLSSESQTPQEEAPARSALEGAGPGARNVSPGLMNIAQTYGTILNSFNQPLSWGSAPLQGTGMPAAGFQSTQAAQVPGMSLNSFQMPSMGVGFGVPSLGYGFG